MLCFTVEQIIFKGRLYMFIKNEIFSLLFIDKKWLNTLIYFQNENDAFASRYDNTTYGT